MVSRRTSSILFPHAPLQQPVLHCCRFNGPVLIDKDDGVCRSTTTHSLIHPQGYLLCMDLNKYIITALFICQVAVCLGVPACLPSASPSAAAAAAEFTCLWKMVIANKIYAFPWLCPIRSFARSASLVNIRETEIKWNIHWGEGEQINQQGRVMSKKVILEDILLKNTLSQ